MEENVNSIENWKIIEEKKMKNNNPRDKYIEYLKKNSISDENIKIF